VEFEEICRRNKVPLTIQRRLVLQTLSPRSDHPTADQLFDEVRKQIPEISRTTVYRVLETFVRIGVARKVCHPGAAARYEMKEGRHHHLVCLSCEAMIDLQDPSLDHLALPDASSGFQIVDYSVQFRGLCAKCAAKQSSARSSRKLKSATPARKPKTRPS
jgi:Fur family peroxide stress response transcriptional regulator